MTYFVFKGKFIHKKTKALIEKEISFFNNELIVYDSGINNYYPANLYVIYIGK